MKLGKIAVGVIFGFSAIQAVMASAVDINTATVDELVNNLNGVGQKKAEAIIEYRNKNNGFHDISELLEVNGIGEKIIEMNKENISIEKQN